MWLSGALFNSRMIAEHGRQNHPSHPARLDANAKSKMQSDVTSPVAKSENRKKLEKKENYKLKI